MNVFITVIIIVISLLVLIYFLKIQITVSYSHHKDDDELNVCIRTLFFLTYTFSAPLIKVDKQSAAIVVENDQKMVNVEKEKNFKLTPETAMQQIQRTSDFLKHIAGFHKILRYFLHKIKVSRFQWESHIGLNDAVWTAMLVGLGWSVKGGVIGLVGTYMRFVEKPIVEIIPYFQAVVSKTNFKCMITFRLGHAIIAALLIMRHWKRRPVLFGTAKENV